jgi:3',5'-cyclic AMP phosphodiesterase CpdA
MLSLVLAATSVVLADPPADESATRLRPIAAPLAAAPLGADLVFAVAGDNRPTARGAPLPRVLTTIVEELAWIRPDLVLWSGDAIYGYCDSRVELENEYAKFLHLARGVGAPIFVAPGNHEIHAGAKGCEAAPAADGGPACSGECANDVFRAKLGPLYGSLDFAGVHFIALDTSDVTNDNAIAGAQLAWLQADLERSRNASAIFVFSHSEFYSSPSIDPPDGKSHPPVANHDDLHELFRRYPVKAVFSGHEHVYWREDHDGIAYFTSGGAGAPAYATPDRGGFAHYLVVRLHNGTPSFDVIEPGRLGFAADDSPQRAAAHSREERFWVVNGNDTPVPLRGLLASTPVRIGACSRLVAESGLPVSNGKEPLPISLSCRVPSTLNGAPARLHTSGNSGESRFLLSLEAPARTSVPVLIRQRSAG